MATTVTTKGQVTIPVAVRGRLGIEAGGQVQFELNSAGQVVLTKVGGGLPKAGLMRSLASPVLGQRPTS